MKLPGVEIISHHIYNYIGQRFGDLRYALRSIKHEVLVFVVGVCFAVLVPFVHFGVVNGMIWVPDKAPVNTTTCRCGCFDTIFKGSYEKPGSTKYKHIYFNTTTTTLKIWTFSLVFILVGYESVRYLLTLASQKRIRWSMFCLFLMSFYPHYYSWWAYFNYYNDGFLNFYYHQLFFTLTELVSTFVVIHLCDIQNDVTHWKILLIVTVNTIHVLLAGLDQFFEHVFLAGGTSFQFYRDIGLMIPDLLFIVVPLCVLRQQKKRDTLIPSLRRVEVALFSFLVVCGVTIGRSI